MRDMQEVGRIGQLQGAHMEEVEFVVFDRVSEQVLHVEEHIIRHELRERQNGDGDVKYKDLLDNLIENMFPGSSIKYVGSPIHRNMLNYTLQDESGNEMDIAINARLHMWQRYMPSQASTQRLELK